LHFQSVSVPQTEVGSGQTPNEPDINLNPVFDRLGPPSVDLEDMEASFSAFNKPGQDLSLTNYDGIHPLFVVVDHELATPDGIEGPVPVSVKPDFGVSLLNETNQTDEKIETDSNNAQSESLST